MKRRRFLERASVAGVAGLATGCRPSSESEGRTRGAAIRWKMVTTWPPQLPLFGSAAARLARRIGAVSGGELTVDVYGAGELVPAFEAFDTVSRGVAEIGHASPAYWRGKTPAAQLFTGVPFGMTAGPLNAWLHFGGGWDLWRETYAAFDLVPFPAGNTGFQMGGWYRKPITSVADLKGLKIRVAGLGAEVLEAVGATPVIIPGAELFTALKTGTIDATEFAGPMNDMAFGLHRAAPVYHYPGWHEPSGMVECFVNRGAWEALPDHLRETVREVCVAENDRCEAEFNARNQRALSELLALDSVDVVPFPSPVLEVLRDTSRQVLDRIAEGDAGFRRVWESFTAFPAEAARGHAGAAGPFFDALRR